MSNDAPKQESSFGKGFGFAAGVFMFLFLCFIGAMLGRMLAERYGPPSTWSRPATVGTPGSGYVSGAPRNAKECTDRDGSVVPGGKGCQGYR